MHAPRKMNAYDQAIADRVLFLRLERGLSQKELARTIGVTYQLIQQYEGGLCRIPAKRLEILALALDVPVTFFFESSR